MRFLSSISRLTVLPVRRCGGTDDDEEDDEGDDEGEDDVLLRVLLE